MYLDLLFTCKSDLFLLKYSSSLKENKKTNLVKYFKSFRLFKKTFTNHTRKSNSEQFTVKSCKNRTLNKVLMSKIFVNLICIH